MKEDIHHKVSALFASRTAHELMVYGFFVLLSAAAWLMQVLHDNYDTELTIPLQLTDVPDNVVITDSIPREIAVKVSDRGTTLMNFFLTKKNTPVTISFADYQTSNPIGTIRVSSTELQKQVQSHLPNSTNIQHIISDTVQFSYNRGISRRLPIRFNGTIKTQQHVYVNSITMSVDSVNVYAPLEILDTMQYAPTQHVHIDDMKADAHLQLSMAHHRSMHCIPDTVGVKIHIDSYTEKSVEVPITGINFPAGKSLRTFPSKISLTFRVGMANYNNVTAENFTLTVSYEDLIRTGHCYLRLKSVPEGVSNPRLSKTEVDFLIEQEN